LGHGGLFEKFGIASANNAFTVEKVNEKKKKNFLEKLHF